MKKNIIHTINTVNLYKKMMQKNEYSYDIYFRMAVIDEYLKENEDIWNIYYKMQLTRTEKIKKVPKYMINHKQEFIILINDIKNNGYNYDKPILINKKYMVIDGAHRLACALYFNIKNVSIITNDEFYNFIPTEYTKDWFLNNDLNECITYAEKQKEKILRRV